MAQNQVLQQGIERERNLIENASKLVSEVGGLIGGAHPADESAWLQEILERTVRFFSFADAGIVSFYDKESGFDEVVASYIKDPTIYMDIHLRSTEGTTHWCYNNKQPRIWSASDAVGMAADPVDEFFREQLWLEQLKPAFLNSALLCCPLIADNEVLGAIQLEHYSDETQFSELEMQMLFNLVAVPLARALKNGNVYSRIQNRNSDFSRFYQRVVLLREKTLKQVTQQIDKSVEQTLAGIHIALRNLSTIIDGEYDRESLHQYLDELDCEAQRAIEDIQGLAYVYGMDMRESVGIIGTLETMMNRRCSKVGINAHFEVENLEDDNLDERLSDALFHVAQQAIENVVNHSRAENIYMVLTGSDKNAVLTITDDGCGFTKADLAASDNPCFGLRGMSERLSVIGGSLIVFSQIDGGTKISAVAPLPIQSEEAER